MKPLGDQRKEKKRIKATLLFYESTTLFTERDSTHIYLKNSPKKEPSSN